MPRDPKAKRKAQQQQKKGPEAPVTNGTGNNANPASSSSSTSTSSSSLSSSNSSSSTNSSSSSTSSSSSSSSAAAPPVNHHSSSNDESAVAREKEHGNKLFAAGKYQGALDAFSSAIKEAEKSDASEADRAILPSVYSNRSATQFMMKHFQEALEDADHTVKLNPQWPKGWLRKASAHEGLLQYHESLTAYRQGLSVDSNDAGLKKGHEELLALLDELKLTESQLSSSYNPDADRFEMMVRWMKTAGSKFPKLYLQYYSEDYRGVHVLTNIPQEEIILYVPHSIIMTSQVAMDSDIGQKIIKAQIDLRSKHSYLACYLLEERERGKTSYWWPYINILPVKYENMPIFFSSDKLKFLKGSFTLQKIADRIESLRAEYDNIKAAIPEFGRFTYEDFVWARLVVITRIFGLVIKGTKTDGLVPYADMLNHKKPTDANDADTKWTFDDPSYGFTITTLRTIRRGEQVYDSYGRKCNSRFFVNYGFSLDNNDEDNEVVLRFALPSDDPHFSMKLRMLGGREYSTRREFQIPATYRETSDREKKTKEMFSWLRFIHAQDSELMLLQSSEEFKIEEIEPISIRNEIAVLRHIQQSARDQLAQFDEPLEHDLKLLAANDEKLKDFNFRNIVIQRKGEKIVLHWYIDLADKCIPLLQMPWKDVKRLTAKCNVSQQSALDHYITTVVVPLVKKSH